MGSPIRLRYRLGPSDLVRALELHTACPGLIAVLGWAVSAAALALVGHREGTAAWIIEALLLLAGSLTLLAFATPLCAAWRWHRSRGFFAPHELVADAEGVELSGGCRSGRLPWSKIRRWRESSRQFLLYQSRAEFVVVPKHAFGSRADLTAFKAALLTHLGPSGGWCAVSPDGSGAGR